MKNVDDLDGRELLARIESLAAENTRLRKELLRAQREMTARELAEFMHDEYEQAAFLHSWHTQKSCQVPFNRLPQANRLTLMRVARAVLKKLEPEGE